MRAFRSRGREKSSEYKEPMARKRRQQQLFTRAVQAQIDGQLDEAVRQLRRLLRERPRDHEALHQLGLVRWQRGEKDEALDALEASAAMKPDVARYQANLGNVYQAVGRTRAALAALQRAVALQPGHASSWSNLGVALRIDGQLDDAISALQKATALASDNTVAWQNLGSALEQQGRLDEAQAALQEAAALDPADAETWTAMGKLSERRGAAPQAESMYRRALLCDRAYAPAWSNLGGLLRRQGRLADAVDACENAIAADPGLADAYTHFGLALREQGHVHAAAATWQRGLQARLTPEGLLNLSDALDEMGLTDQSQAALSDLVTDFPAFAAGWLALGRTRLVNADRDAAREAFQRALELEPGNAEARHFLDAVEGRTTDQAPRDYVRQLFDEYAGRFEQHLTGTLAYRTPQAVADMLGAEKVGTIVDMGCGTGLVGPLVRERCSRLVGVDLSPRMIGQARQKGVYDELIVGALEEALSDVGAVDVAIAADVFIYFGDLAGVLSAAAGAQRLVFSIESHDEEADWVLRGTGRYAHRPGYVRSAAAAAGFEVAATEETTLRKERGEWVAGVLFDLVRRPAGQP